MKRIYYVVCPGWMMSKNDGQQHYVGVQQLMRLYGINERRHDVHIHPERRDEYHGWNPPSDAVYLWPRYHGDYERMPVYESDTGNDE